MANVAILTCSNLTQDLGCPSYQCMKAIRDGIARFDRYSDEEGVELFGIINCAGCPTAVVPEKLFERVRSLVATGVEAVHLSTCMTVLCPFKKKYLKLLGEKFPEVAFVEGTHDAPEGATAEEMAETMKTGIKGLLTQPRMSMADVIGMTMNKE